MALILVDVDCPVADLYPEWYGLYNKDYNDDLTPKRVTDWNLHNFVKPECNKKIYEYLKVPTLYDNVRIVDGAVWGIKTLRKMGHRCVFASAGIHPGKVELLKRNDLLDAAEKDYVGIADKSLIPADYMVDDYYGNIQSFNGKVGILWDAAHNRHHSHPYRAKSWYDVVKIVRAVEAWKNRERVEYAD